MTFYFNIIRFLIWLWSTFLVIAIVKSPQQITYIFPMFGLLLITEQYFSSPATGPLISLVIAVIVTFIGFFGVIIIPSTVTEKLVLILEIVFIWLLFVILQKLSEIITTKRSQYEEQMENLKIRLTEFQLKLNELPEELNRLTKQKNSFAKFNTIATELGSILNMDILINRIKELAEKFIGHGRVTMKLSTETSMHADSTPLATDDPVCQWVISNNYPLHIRDISTDGKILSGNTKLGYSSTIAAPIKIFNKLSGYIQLKDSQTYTDEEFRLFLIFNSIVELALTNAELFAKTQELSITDSLTGLFVHSFFKERLTEEFYRAKSYNIPLSLVMIDIDHFKNINDTYGHKAGDTILQQLAQIFKKHFRETDIIARYGGEEFAVIMIQTSAENAVNVAERLRKLVSEEVFLVTEDQKDTLIKKFIRLKITISAGVAEITGLVEDPTTFINIADNALYKAKTSGRNRVEISTTL